MVLIVMFIVGAVCFAVGFIVAALLSMRDLTTPQDAHNAPGIRITEGDNVHVLRVPRTVRKQAW